MTIHNSLSELIGNTPLVKLHHVTDGIKATIAVKVEYSIPVDPPRTASPSASSTPPNAPDNSSPAV